MIRLKYVPDGWVLINDNYQAQFEEFAKDCKTLKIDNPLKKDEYLLYTSPRESKDRQRGMEYINSEGNHGTGDDTLNPAMQNIIDNIKSFISQRKKVNNAQIKAAQNAIPPDMRLQNSYLIEWPIAQQLEAICDKLNNDDTKFNKMNEDFKRIKSSIT